MLVLLKEKTPSMGTVHLFSLVASLIGRPLVGLNHLGIQKAPSRNALSHQNARRDAMGFRDIYRLLHKRLGQQAVTCRYR
jgi:hypothetical protein